MDFYVTGIKTYFYSKNVLIVMVAILINKDGFESVYNELKFTVQNHTTFVPT